MTRSFVLRLMVALSLIGTGCAGPVATSVTPETPAPLQPTSTRTSMTSTSTAATEPASTLTRVPTSVPTFASTSTLAATLTPATPAVNSDRYRLKPWSAADDQERIAQMETLAAWTAEHNPGYHDALAHGMQRYIAVAELEAWQYQTEPADADLIWDAIGHLARAGDPLASDALTRLISQALNDDRMSLDDLATWSRLEALSDGEPAQVQRVPTLFGDGREGWILTVGQEHGAVWSIAPEPSGARTVTLIVSAWESAHESGLFVSVDDPPDGATPEIWVEHMIQAGGGPSFAAYETHAYTWRNEQWIDLTDGGLSSAGAESWSAAVPLEPGERSAFELHTLLDPYQYPMCSWKIAYRFARAGGGYAYRRAEVPVPPTMPDPNELLCAARAWDWAVTSHDVESLLIWMEDAWAHWPAPETDLGIPLGTVREAFGSDFPAFFHFQLGRFEALAGHLDRAKMRLSELVAQPSDPDRVRAQGLAARYLGALPDLAAAESTVAPDLKVGEGVPWSPLPFQSSSGRRSDWTLTLGEIERFLWLEHQPAQALERLAAFDLACVDPAAREPYDCARPLYLEGLASEGIGDSVAAVAAYVRVWQMFPDSPYAVLARMKLEPVFTSGQPDAVGRGPNQSPEQGR